MVDIKISFLEEQVESGMKIKELAQFYELPVAQMKKALKQANLRIRSFRKPQFNLIDDTVADIQIENIVPNVEFEESTPTNIVETENQAAVQAETEIAQEISW